MVTTAQLEAFLERQKQLLAEERQAEIDQTSLLLSNCSPKLLEKKGLALLGLGVVNVNIGLGGKSFVELERPSAHHSSPLFPPHTFRQDFPSIASSILLTNRILLDPGISLVSRTHPHPAMQCVKVANPEIPQKGAQLGD
ncbi:hypothetical protein FRC15_011315 [Serendipita sp. 397]|nr:hypothetical protein FRC15_011315 [Serendipita sp. 397]